MLVPIVITKCFCRVLALHSSQVNTSACLGEVFSAAVQIKSNEAVTDGLDLKAVTNNGINVDFVSKAAGIFLTVFFNFTRETTRCGGSGCTCIIGSGSRGC